MTLYRYSYICCSLAINARSQRPGIYIYTNQSSIEYSISEDEMINVLLLFLNEHTVWAVAESFHMVNKKSTQTAVEFLNFMISSL